MKSTISAGSEESGTQQDHSPCEHRPLARFRYSGGLPVFIECPDCGYQMDWAECHMIDCEDGQYDLSEEDCINYDRGTYATCQECGGKGGHWYCPNKDCTADNGTALP